MINFVYIPPNLYPLLLLCLLQHLPYLLLPLLHPSRSLHRINYDSLSLYLSDFIHPYRLIGRVAYHHLDNLCYHVLVSTLGPYGRGQAVYPRTPLILQLPQPVLLSSVLFRLLIFVIYVLVESSEQIIDYGLD